MFVILTLQSQKKINTNFLVLSQLVIFKTTCKAGLKAVYPKIGNSRCFAYVTVLYGVCKEIVELNSVVFKSKPIKIEDAKIKPKARSQQYKMFGNSSKPIMQKQKTIYQQHRSQYQQPAAQYLPILQSPHQQNFLLKSQYALKGATEIKTSSRTNGKSKRSLQNQSRKRIFVNSPR